MAHAGKDVDTIMEQYPTKPEYLIFLLQDIQSSYGYISPESMQRACDHAGVPPVIDEADEHEERARANAMVDHLQDRAIHRILVEAKQP